MALLYKIDQLNWKDDLTGLVKQMKNNTSLLDYSSTAAFIRWMGKQGHFVTREGCDTQKIQSMDKDLKVLTSQVPIDEKKIRDRIESTLKTFKFKAKGPSFKGMQAVKSRNHQWSSSKIPLLDRSECQRRIDTAKHYVCAGIPAAISFRITDKYKLASYKTNHEMNAEPSKDDNYHVAVAYTSSKDSLLLHDSLRTSIDKQKLKKSGLSAEERYGLLPHDDGCSIIAVNVVLSEFQLKQLSYLEEQERWSSMNKREEDFNWETKELPPFDPKAHKFKMN
jgi:hypothetical protein